MYHPDVIASRERQVNKTFPDLFPDGLPAYGIDETAQWTADLLTQKDDEGNDLRPLTADDQMFIRATRFRCQIDFAYFGERFVWIDEGGHGLRPLYPLWESQRQVILQLGRLELARRTSRHPDGLLVNILKARQLGVSTLSEALIAHRILLRGHIRALSGADVEDQAGYLFRMVGRIYERLPWFLRPARLSFVKNREMAFGNASYLRTAWGKSTRGALADVGGAGTKGAIGRGQSQPLDALVLTPTGYVPMGALRTGMFVTGANGLPTAVTGVFPQGLRPTYCVTFSDGASVECSSDHLWVVYARTRSDDQETCITASVADLLASGLRGHKNIYRYRVPCVEPVVYHSSQVLPLDPYILGVLLGDGCLSQGAAKFVTADADLAAHVAALLPSNHRLGRIQPRAACPTYSIVSTGKVNRVRLALQALGLSGTRSETKFIPPIYLHASPTDRVRLLQGLLDTDGWPQTEGTVGFCSTSRRLALDLQALIEALGGVATLSLRQSPQYQYKGEQRTGQPQWRLAIRLPRSIAPFWLARKLDKHDRSGASSRTLSRRIVSIDYIGEKLSQCIRVAAADSLYVTEHCLVTHNTFSAVHISELATWDNPDQLDSALFPAIPVHPDTLVILESTAEHAMDWWHQHWLTAGDGVGRFANLFIPWYAEPGKYALPPPAGWSPSSMTLAHAEKCERDSSRWLGGTVHLSREQLYWYETTRAYYTKKNELYRFLREYPADDLECVTGDTRISTEQGLIRMDAGQSAAVCESGAIVEWLSKGVRPVLTLTTTQGRCVTATPEHRFARPDGTWTTLTDLHPGDEIVLAPPIFMVEALHRVCWNWAPACTMEVVVDEELGRLLGYFLGGGSWGTDCIEAACCGIDTDVVADVVGLCERVIGRRPTTAIRGINGGCTTVRSSSVRWWEVFWNLGLLDRRLHKKQARHGGYKKRLAVPECIWRSPQRVIRQFLRGLFESDGHAHKQARAVSLFSTSPELLREIQLLLLGFGIDSAIQAIVKITRGKRFPGACLRLGAEAADLFHTKIGFVSQRKQTSAFIKHGKGGSKPRRATGTDRIASIVPAGEAAVYDIGVLPTHYFGANGVKVHNCFQYAGRAIFSFEQLDAIDAAGSRRPLQDVWRVDPARDIAALRREAPASRRDDPRPPAPLTPRLPAAFGPHAPVLYPIPPGYGFDRVPPAELRELPNLRGGVFAIWEYPRSRGPRRYILSVDVGDGLGQDYSIVDVVRLPTIDEPAEQVAQFCSNRHDTKALAFVCDAIGRLYPDQDGSEALAAIETNNHGLAVQDMLQLHLGYSNFYIWEYADSGDPARRYSTKIGWVTTSRTRPLLIAAYYTAITTFDPATSLPDLILNSPITRGELRHFVTESTIGEAEAARGQHDDAVMASAIGYYVAWRQAGGELEPIDERRRRRAAERAHSQTQAARKRLDWRNTAVSAEQAAAGSAGGDEDGEQDGGNGGGGGGWIDERNSITFFDQ